MGGNPLMDQHPVQGGVAIPLGMHHANETRISSGFLGLWLVCAFTFYLTSGYPKKCFHFIKAGNHCWVPLIVA